MFQPLVLRESEPPTVAGRTLTVRVATYGRVYRVGSGRERVAVGAFRGPIARPAGVLRFKHQGERPGESDDPLFILGAVRALRDVSGSLLADVEVLSGERGDHLIALVESGTIRGASMSALVSGQQMVRDADGPLREIQRVSSLAGLSITDVPAYDDAGVLALRDAETAARVESLRVARAEMRAWVAGRG